jgi:hypothetical protein
MASGIGGIPGGNCAGNVGAASPSCALPLHAGERSTERAADGIAVGCGTLTGWLHPGQGTVFPNAFSVTFSFLRQCGQSILKAIC